MDECYMLVLPTWQQKHPLSSQTGTEELIDYVYGGLLRHFAQYKAGIT